MNRMTRLILALPLFGALVAMGCGKSTSTPASATGKISYKGTTVGGGSIAFVTADGARYSSPIKGDGTYTVSQLPVGEMTVTIETDSANKDRKDPNYGGGMAKGGPTGSPRPDTAKADAGGSYVKIPAKYKDAKTSGLKVSLTASKNSKDFDLAD